MPKTAGLNLDDIERPNAPGPFPVTIGGKTYHTVDPESLDFRELLEFLESFNKGNSIKAVEVMIKASEREAFFKNELPPFKLTALADGYIEHYGLKTGEADASPPS